MMAMLRKLGFLGRTSRTTLVNFLILCLAGSVAVWFLLLPHFRDAVHGRPPAAGLDIFLVALGIVEIALGLVWLWLTVRRFHDQDRPGWLALLPTALGVAVRLGAPVSPVILLVVLIGFLIALFLPGTVGPNRYGPDPRGWKSREHFDQQRRR